MYMHLMEIEERREKGKECEKALKLKEFCLNL